MAKEYDVVMIGAGHNGLIAGAYLVKAGLNVCFLEQAPIVGGGNITLEVAAPGFKSDICSTFHVFIQGNPLIRNDELDLQSKYGLKYILPDNQSTVLFPDDTYITLFKDVDKTCQSIAKFSEKDADNYKKCYEWCLPLLDMLTEGMFNPAPDFGTFASLLSQSEPGRGLLRTMMQSGKDFADEWFESSELRILSTRWASEGLLSPQTKGTAIALLMMIPLIHKYGGAGYPVGGSGELSKSVERFILANGGTIRCDSLVEKINVTGGEAKSVVLSDGEEIIAKKAIISNLHIKQLFPGMVGKENLSESFIQQVARTQSSGFSCMNIHLALNEAPKYIATAEDDFLFVEFSPLSYEKYLRCFDDLEYGHINTDLILSVCNTQFDPTRAPEGKHVLYLYHYEPYELADGGPEKWDEIKMDVADEILAKLRKQTTNMGDDNIIGKWVESPLDIERRTKSMLRGDFMHLGHFMHQTLGNRPLPIYNVRTPIDKLYMCGPSCHPGGGISGGGRAQVQPVMEDLGIDFLDLIK